MRSGNRAGGNAGRPETDVAARLIRDHFRNRTDVLAFLAPWNTPCPCQADGSLDAMIAAHPGASGPRRSRCAG
jgi:hypothetical protein